MPRLRLIVLLAASATLALAGCTDPSPDTPTAAPTTSSPSPSTEATTEASEDASTEVAEIDPIFGTAQNTGTGGASLCLDHGDASESTLSTVLTAGSAITIESVTLTPASPDIEILDQYVLPYEGGLGGLTIGSYPPDDRDGDREDAVGRELAAEETVIIGIGVAIAESAQPSDMELGISYSFSGSGDTEELGSGYRLIIAEDCYA